MLLEERWEIPVHVERIGELLQGGYYEEAAEVLFDAQQQYQSEKGTSLLTTLLAMTYQICLLLSRCGAEIEWYREAGSDAQEREIALREQLYLILKLANELARGREDGSDVVIELPNFPITRHEKSDLSANLWQQLRRLLQGQESDKSPAAAGPARPAVKNPTPVSSSPTVSAHRLLVYCLGTFEVYRDDELVTNWESRKAMSIFKYLLIHRKQAIHKERLMEMFWPDSRAETARNNLNVAIFSLRKSLRSADDQFSHILFQDDCYALNPELDVWIDYEAFLEHAEEGQRCLRAGETDVAIAEYEAAEMTYQGTLFGENDYEPWSQPPREYASDTYIQILDMLSAHYLKIGDHHACIAACNKLLSVEPAHENAHCRLMRCYSRQRLPFLAQRQYERCLLALKELCAKPSNETITLITHIRAGEAM